jgi:hypothetical protein
MPYSVLTHSSEELYPTTWEFTKPHGARVEAPTSRRTLQPVEKSAWYFNAISEDVATTEKYRELLDQSMEEKRERAQHDIVVLCALTKAVILFRRLAARVRKREEELRAFKRVHIRTSFPHESTEPTGENTLLLCLLRRKMQYRPQKSLL